MRFGIQFFAKSNIGKYQSRKSELNEYVTIFSWHKRTAVRLQHLYNTGFASE